MSERGDEKEAAEAREASEQSDNEQSAWEEGATRPEWVKCIKRPDGQTAWCGRDVRGEWAFVDASHAAASEAQDARLVACGDCVASIVRGDIPAGTRLVVGHGIAAITDEPEYEPSQVGSMLSPDIFVLRGKYTKGVGFGATAGESVHAAIADYTAKKAAKSESPDV